MLEDRDYMREPANRWGSFPRLSGWLVILTLNIVVFFAEYGGGPKLKHWFLEYGALSVEGLKHGYIWQLLTFQFMHGGMSHLVLNSVTLYFFGRALEVNIGRRAFFSLYLISGFAGGIVQVLLGLVSERFAGGVVGASAGLCGLVAAFALLNPQAMLYVFFVIPIRAIYLLPLLLVSTILFIVFPSGDNVAHGAHLGGMLAGIAWLKFAGPGIFETIPGEGLLARLRFWGPSKTRQRKRELVRAASVHGRSWPSNAADPEAELPPAEFISKEVDPILDKISAHGIQSLTERERKILEVARKKMGKR